MSAPGRLKIWIAEQINAASHSTWGAAGRTTIEFDAHAIDIRAAQGFWRTSRFSEACRWDAHIPVKVTYHDSPEPTRTYSANIYSECYTMTELRRLRGFGLVPGDMWLSFEPVPRTLHPASIARLK